MKTFFAFAVLAVAVAARAVDATPDLTGYRTVHTALTTTLAKSPTTALGRTGYLGVHIEPDAKGRLVVSGVADGSAAEKAGVQVGDVLRLVDRRAVNSVEALRDGLQSKAPDDFAVITVERKGRSLDLLAKLAATSRPKKLAAQRAVMGIRTGEVTDQGAPVTAVTSGMPADKAGLKPDDVIVKVAGTALAAGQSVSELLAEKSPGDRVAVIVRGEVWAGERGPPRPAGSSRGRWRRNQPWSGGKRL